MNPSARSAVRTARRAAVGLLLALAFGCADTGVVGETVESLACEPACEGPERCDRTRGVCVEPECDRDPDCADDDDDDDEPYCVEARCVECRTAADCEDDEPLCIAGECSECARDEDCTDGDVCDEGRCREPDDDDDKDDDEPDAGRDR